ncbi:AbfB domain-containing protein [Micromonospora sp. NPDC049891]|uniref:AbfB domain-containing protein n=1 Tax=Micromonospora sp. NPDC049891 TaxID=3155655 RepID=UPI0033DD572A
MTALRDGAPQEPIRGEFVAGMPLPDGAADDPANGLPPGTDGTGSDIGNDETAPPGLTADPVVRPGLNPRADAGSGSTAPGSTPANPATNVPPPAPSAPAPPPSAAPARPAGPKLVPGARIGLEAASQSGHRVRHANFQARVEPVNATSSAGTKADAAFIVRSGLASGSCVSFESVNFPGHYLRHSEFRVFLHRAEGSALFRADATFCPVTGIGGRHTSLRSHNYPDRYLSHHPHAQMRISQIGDGAASSTATFLIRPAL